MADSPLTKEEKVEKLSPDARARYDAHLIEIEHLVREQLEEEKAAAADRKEHNEHLKFIGENLDEQLLAMDLILDPPPQMAMDFNEGTAAVMVPEEGIDPATKKLLNDPKALEAAAGMVPDGCDVTITVGDGKPVVLDQDFKNTAQERAKAIRETQAQSKK